MHARLLPLLLLLLVLPAKATRTVQVPLCFAAVPNSMSQKGDRPATPEEEEREPPLSTIPQAPKYKVMGQIVTLESPWLTIQAERLLDDKKQLLEYWRVEKADSIVVLTLHNSRLVFPKPVYRVGIDQTTLDFPGGRLSVPEAGNDVLEDPQDHKRNVVIQILKRELGIAGEDDIDEILPLNFRGRGWPINSSFSNQQLFGYVATLKEACCLDPAMLYDKSYDSTNQQELLELLQTELTCLQCRAVLQEWMLQQQNKKSSL